MAARSEAAATLPAARTAPVASEVPTKVLRVTAIRGALVFDCYGWVLRWILQKRAGRRQNRDPCTWVITATANAYATDPRGSRQLLPEPGLRSSSPPGRTPIDRSWFY